MAGNRFGSITIGLALWCISGTSRGIFQTANTVFAHKPRTCKAPGQAATSSLISISENLIKVIVI